MTRRERLERKQELRSEWAAKAEVRADARFATAHSIVENIPLGQPILIGHHSERRHRRDLDRMATNMSKGVEESKLADHHRSCADGLAHALETSIFSDDPDAIDQLEAKLARLLTEQERDKAINRAVRKVAKLPEPERADRLAVLLAEIPGFDAADLEKRTRLARQLAENVPGYGMGIPSYSLSNRNGEISRTRKRIEDVWRRQQRAAKAEAAGGVVIEGTGDYVRVTFAEKPDRDTLNALRAAEYRWGGGSWVGRTDKLPACVREVAHA
jgi:DNA primase